MVKKILVVDDELSIRELIGLILSDYDIIEASNGKEALQRFEEHQPDLVLMDVMMPEMNGVKTTEAILQKNPSAKILAITAYKTHTGKEILEAGALEILEKPFRKKELERLVEKMLSESKESLKTTARS